MSDPKSSVKVSPELLCVSAPDSKCRNFIYFSGLTWSYARDYDMFSVYGDTRYIEIYLRIKVNIPNQTTMQTWLFELQMGEGAS